MTRLSFQFWHNFLFRFVRDLYDENESDSDDGNGGSKTASPKTKNVLRPNVAKHRMHCSA